MSLRHALLLPLLAACAPAADTGEELDPRDALYQATCTALPGLSGEPTPSGVAAVAYAWVGDVDGDGWGDWVLTLLSAEASELALYLGHEGFEIQELLASAPPFQLPPGRQATFTGVDLDYVLTNGRLPVGRAGDLDGDGLWDLIFGDPAVVDGGRTPAVHLVYGHPEALSGDVDVTEVGLPILGEVGGNLGWSVAGGDLDQDGLSDLVIADVGTETDPGAVRVFYGRDGGWEDALHAADADWTIEGLAGLRAYAVTDTWWYTAFPTEWVQVGAAVDEALLDDLDAAWLAVPVRCKTCDAYGTLAREDRLLTEGERRTGAWQLTDLEWIAPM